MRRERGHELDRRSFLRLAGGGILGVIVIPIAGCEFNGVDPITAGERVRILTPVEEFYYKNGAEISISDWSMPSIRPEDWSMEITGLVSSPTTIRMSDLEAHASDRVDLLKTMRCVIDSNEVRGLIGTAVWTGVPLRIFLDQAGIDLGSTRRLRLYGADGFRNNIPVDRIYGQVDPTLAEPLLVTAMNGVPLPSRHGAPVRLILHEAFGYKNVKWITKVEAVAEDDPFGTYQDAGFVDDGEMRLTSRTTNPLMNASVPAGDLLVSGFAVSGRSGIERVEVSVNGGEWVPADLVGEEGMLSSDPLIPTTLQASDPDRFAFPWRGVWRTWDFRFTATKGRHALRIRAIDADGNVQPEVDPDGISDGVNAWATLAFDAT